MCSLIDREDKATILINNNESDEDSIYDDDTEEKLIIEARNRFLMALKGEYYYLFALSQCGADAFILLKESTDWDLDRETLPMSSWDYVSSHFINPTYFRFLFFMKSVPVIGRIAKNSLFSHLSYTYDVVLNYIQAHEALEQIAQTVRTL